MFRELNQRAAESLQELQAASKLDPPPRDPWTGEPYSYRLTPRGLAVYSLGADRVVGGADYDADISSFDFR